MLEGQPPRKGSRSGGVYSEVPRRSGASSLVIGSMPDSRLVMGPSDTERVSMEFDPMITEGYSEGLRGAGLRWLIWEFWMP